MKVIQLSQGFFAVVSDQDFPTLNQFNWSVQKNRVGRYAQRRKIGGATVKMHREILGIIDPKIEVDHRDGNGLNNCRENLRTATHQHNSFGFRHKKIGVSSKFRGVSWASGPSKWRASLKLNGSFRHLGYFKTEEEAARAYDSAATNFFGEFAAPNFSGSNEAARE